MNKVLWLVLAGMLILSGFANAIPYYFTYEGTVGIVDDSFGAAASAGVSDGDSVRYIFLYDIDRLGGYTLNNGTFEEHERTLYAEFIGGRLLDLVMGGYYSTYFNSPSDHAENNFVFFLESASGGIGASGAYGGPKDNPVSISTTGGAQILSTALERFSFRAYEYAHGVDSSTTLASNLRLTSVTEVPPAPVPEPSTFLLLGGGLAGLAFYARRRRKE